MGRKMAITVRKDELILEDKEVFPLHKKSGKKPVSKKKKSKSTKEFKEEEQEQQEQQEEEEASAPK